RCARRRFLQPERLPRLDLPRPGGALHAAADRGGPRGARPRVHRLRMAGPRHPGAVPGPLSRRSRADQSRALASIRDGPARHLRVHVSVLGAQAAGISGDAAGMNYNPLGPQRVGRSLTMHAFDRMCRAIAAGLLVVAVAGISAGPAYAQSKSSKAKSAATTLPEPLTHDSIRELVSRLSDEDVRKLLID